MVNRYKKTATATEVKSGSLLISTPVNSKFNNSKLLILVTQHDESGTTGIIINKWLPGEKITKTVHGNSEPVVLQYGGPDNFNSDSYLILYPSFKNGWIDSVFWSYDTIDIVTILHFMSEYNIQISAYKGCISWKPGELDAELSKKLWWFTNDYQIHTVLQPGSISWKQYAKKYGGHFANLIEDDIPIFYN